MTLRGLSAGWMARSLVVTATLCLVACGVLAASGCSRNEAIAQAPATEPKVQDGKQAPPAVAAPPAAAAPKKEAAAHPFPRRIPMPDFPRPKGGDYKWINSEPLNLKKLRGKFVLLDFWTYCCINCMHVLPELKKLERAYPNELVVIGVHSAKFETEKDEKNILEAVLRHDIEHPVVVDSEHDIWNMIGIQSWPSLLLIDPEGNAVHLRAGEIKFEQYDEILKRALPYYREQKLIDAKPLTFPLEKFKLVRTPLFFPGKILADEKSNRLFIADSNHHRIVMTDLDGKLAGVIGSGKLGRSDGPFAAASFNQPQGMAVRDDVLYVADTENHLLRKVDLKTKTVSTIAGTGVQARGPWPGMVVDGDDFFAAPKLPERFVGPPATTALNSPWDLWLHGDALYIAMAGPHQIWKMSLDGKEIGPFAGNGREDIVDGPLLPKMPYDENFCSLAQPSGLASDGKWLYVADSEGSSIRAVPFDPAGKVETIVGTAHLARGRLFHFGDRDGEGEQVLLQHCLGVVWHAGQVYVADTYNNKIKVVDPKRRSAKTIAGAGKPGRTDAPATFDEPAGISYARGKLYVADTNNHLIRTVELASGKTATLTIAGLEPPPRSVELSKPALDTATQVKVDAVSVKPVDGKVKLSIDITLPAGWKANPAGKTTWYVESTATTGPLDRAALGKTQRLEKPQLTFDLTLPAAKPTGEEPLRVFVDVHYCRTTNEAECRSSSIVWNVPVRLTEITAATAVPLKYQVRIDDGK